MRKYNKDYTKAPNGAPLSNPELIAFHHAVAHVLHVSGAGDAIDLSMHRLFPPGSIKTMNADELVLRLSGLELMNSMLVNSVS